MAISEPMNMYEFTTGFIGLGCHDVLYLDGTISKLWVRGDDDTLADRHQFAAMLAVF